MEQTTNYGLNKPGGSDYARINVLNANMDAVDAALKELEESKAEGAALAAHEADGVKHVTEAERTAWNAKADGTATGAHIARTDNPHGVTAAQVGAVPTTRKVNGKALSADVTLTAGDVGAIPFDDSRADIPEGADLNSYTAVGVYRCKNNATAGSLTNSPTTDAFIMDILPSTGTSRGLDGNYAYLIQKIMTNGNRYYARKISTNGDVSTPIYDAWIEFYTTRSKPAPADIGAAAVSHSHAQSDVTGLTSALAGKVPTTRKVSGKALSADITLTAGDVGALELLTGSYVGTGVSGSSNPNSITFTKAPRLIILLGKKDSTGEYDPLFGADGGNYYVHLIYADMLTTSYQKGLGLTNYSPSTTYGKKSADGKTFSWYYNEQNKDSYQCNRSDTTYYYAALC